MFGQSECPSTSNILGDYQLLSLLGAGGMGSVFRAYQPSLKRLVAIKILHPELARLTGYIQRFSREAEIASRLEHPHIVPIYDYGVQGPLTYMVMRLLSGGSLSERIRSQLSGKFAPPSLEEISILVKQLADALNYAHSQNIVHSDFKPANVVFSAQGEAVLTDFGIATLVNHCDAFDDLGHVSGTPAYMAPELWLGEAAVPMTDQYALASTVYLMIAGHLPFEALTEAEFMKRHLYELPVALHSIRPDLSCEISSVVNKGLAKDPGDRFPTATAFAGAFEQAVKDLDQAVSFVNVM